MNDLAPFREKIDQLDDQLVKLLNERAEVALQIGAMKEKAGLPVYAPEREEMLLRRIEKKNAGPLRHESLRAIYREIMSASLSLEKDLKVVCAGGRGGMAHLAALSKFGSSLQYVFREQVRDVFLRVETGEADCGVVLLKSAERGIEKATMECFAKSKAVILAEIRLGEGEKKDRFFVIGKGPCRPSGNDRSLVLVRIKKLLDLHSHAVEPFLRRSISLSEVESIFLSGEDGECLCLLEPEGCESVLLSSALLEELKERCLEVRVLGSFPKLGAAGPEGKAEEKAGT